MQNYALLTAGIIFLIVSILHLLRLIFKVEVKINSYVFPVRASMVGLVVSLCLALWMFKSMS